jgi:hypothetical protein
MGCLVHGPRAYSRSGNLPQWEPVLDSSVAQGNHLADVGTSGECQAAFLDVVREFADCVVGPNYRTTVCGAQLATGSA